MTDVTIIYKNGTKVYAQAEELSITKNTLGELLEIEWKHMEPAPLYAGVNDIMAVYEGKA